MRGNKKMNTKDPYIPEHLWSSIWEKYHSEINIEICLCLTEPVCPTAVVVIETPRKVLTDTMCWGNSVEEATKKAYDFFVEQHLSAELKDGN